MADVEVKASVSKVDLKGRHGPYAVALSSEVRGTITFSLGEPTWWDHSIPVEGAVVMLSDLQKMPKGWRAMSARFFRPSDENTNQQS